MRIGIVAILAVMMTITTSSLIQAASGKDALTPREVKATLGGKAEFALIDVREQEEFSRSHQLLASNVPLSRLELVVGNLVPRKGALVILVDGGRSGDAPLAERAAKRLRELGYTNVRVMRGGLAAWVAAGYEEFSGVFVPSKAFGEFVETDRHTPHLEPAELKAMLDSGRKMVVLDARPFDEYTRMNIPGSLNVPGGELVYRIAQIAPDPETFVVVNCAGRTRSIIGAQSLINAGIPNGVAALRGGTMGWELAGLTVERGSDRSFPKTLSPEALALAKKRATAVAAKYGVPFVDLATLAKWRKESEKRSLYVLDVRQAAEFEAGHLPGARNVQGVTLVQSTDEHVGVRSGRVVLVDDTGVRAVMAASWLRQMGLPNVSVLKGGLGSGDYPLETGKTAPLVLGDLEGEAVSPAELNSRVQAAAPPTVVALGRSGDYAKGHVPGAFWVVRSQLDKAKAAIPAPAEVVLTSDDGLLAHVAVADAARLWPGTRVRWLEGGDAAWRKAGLPTEAGMTKALCPAVDVYYRPYEGTRSKAEETQAMKDYLSWEVNLVNGVKRDGDMRFDIR